MQGWLGTDGSFKDIFDVVSQDEFHFFLNMIRQIAQVFLVFFRENYPLDSGPAGGKDFFLDAAHRQNQTALGDFAGHGGVASHRPTCIEGGKGSGDGCSCRGAVLGNGTGRDMNMDRLRDSFADPQLLAMGNDIVVGGYG